MTASAPNASSRLLTLDVMGVGLYIESLFQSKVVEALKRQPSGSILPVSILQPYPVTSAAKKMAINRRGANVVLAGAEKFVHHWAIPTVSVWPGRAGADLANDASSKKIFDFSESIEGFRNMAEMHTHKTISVGSQFANEPEEVMERVFTFFEINPELPALLILATDGDTIRELVGDASREAHWNGDPRQFDCMQESTAALLLARRDRVDALRPFAKRGVPAFSAGEVPPGFKPSKFVPQPWTFGQVQQFDSIPTIAVLHRPNRVSFSKDKDGNSTADADKKTNLMHKQERQVAFKAAFDTALKEIPNGAAARVYYDAGAADPSNHLVSLSLAAHDSLPSIDLLETNDGCDISRRIGNTGAASPFVQWALAAMASSESKNASVTVNLRQRDEATITVVSPPSAMPAKQLQARPAQTLAQNKEPAIIPLAPLRTVALGTRLMSGTECTQSGMWRCEPADVQAGATHFITAGRRLPQVRVSRELTSWQKVRGESSHDLVTATYTLVSYDVPHA